MTLIGELDLTMQPITAEEISEKGQIGRLLAESVLEHEVYESSRVVTGLRIIEGIPENFYNAGAFVGPDGRIVLVGRQVEEAGGHDQPDVGTLVAAILEENSVVETKEIWSPKPSGDAASDETAVDLIEDVRAAEKDGKVAFDVTRLSPLGGKYKPYPAFTEFVDPESLMVNGFPNTIYLSNVDPERFYMQAGKNTTRIWPGHIMYRPDNMDHGFVVHRIGEDGTNDVVQELPFSEVPFWGAYRMGSTMPPVWLNETDAILIVHGITYDQGMYRYTIGSARLHRDEDGVFSIDNVSPNPHLTPEMSADLFPGEQVELHPELRQALYATGGIVHRDDTGNPHEIELFPNVGDTRTISASLSVAGIVRTWDL